MWELDSKESWAQKNWCFWTVVLEKTLESPLDCKEIQPSFLKEISLGCSLEGLMLKLKLQYFGQLIWRANSLEKTLMLGKIEGRKKRGQQRMRWLDGITDSMNMGLGGLQNLWLTGRPDVLQFMGSQRVGHDCDWTELSFSFRSYEVGDGIQCIQKILGAEWLFQLFILKLKYYKNTDFKTADSISYKNYPTHPNPYIHIN